MDRVSVRWKLDKGHLWEAYGLEAIAMCLYRENRSGRLQLVPFETGHYFELMSKLRADIVALIPSAVISTFLTHVMYFLPDLKMTLVKVVDIIRLYPRSVLYLPCLVSISYGGQVSIPRWCDVGPGAHHCTG